MTRPLKACTRAAVKAQRRDAGRRSSPLPPTPPHLPPMRELRAPAPRPRAPAAQSAAWLEAVLADGGGGGGGWGGALGRTVFEAAAGRSRAGGRAVCVSVCVRAGGLGARPPPSASVESRRANLYGNAALPPVRDSSTHITPPPHPAAFLLSSVRRCSFPPPPAPRHSPVEV